MQGTNSIILEHRLKQLMTVTIQKQDSTYETTEISFKTGFWAKEEGYKREVLKDAKKRLRVSQWNELSDTEIVKKVIDAIYFAVDDEKRLQNLVSVPSSIKVMEAFRENEKRTANLVKALFLTSETDDRVVFEEITQVLNGQKVYDTFSVVAYLFFLKDANEYIPMRKDGYLERLPKLGISVECLKSCTWENYRFLISQMVVVKEFLENYFNDVELIDAQSFLWMMWLVNSDTPEYTFCDAEKETKVTTRTIRGLKEGYQTQYYVTRYERSPRNRKEAIRIHGCKCCVCGFDFEKKYGALGKGFIEVHHIVPLASRDEQIEINPETDLVCICANCHRMIHRKVNAVLKPEELKTIIKNAAEGSKL